MLETLREYAAEQIGDTERAVVERRHLDGSVGLAEQGESHLQGPSQAEWLIRLEQEHDNFRAALSRAAENRDPAFRQQGLRLAGALSRFWMLHGHQVEGRRQLEMLLSCQPDVEPSPERGKAHSGAGIMAHYQGDYDAAHRHYEESLAIRRAIGDRHGVASCLNNLGSLAERRGDYRTAQNFHEESLAIRRELEDPVGISYSLNNLGNVAYLQGDYVTARAHHQESLELKRETGEQWGIATSLENLGSVLFDMGDLAEAERLYRESLAIRRELSDRS
jgi:non-specific serine/threonine protein kinase